MVDCMRANISVDIKNHTIIKQRNYKSSRKEIQKTRKNHTTDLAATTLDIFSSILSTYIFQ